MKTMNNQLVTEPFNEKGIEAKVNSGFASINQKATIRQLMVLVGNDNVPTGAIIFVNAEAYVQPWAKKIYKQDNVLHGKEFIIVPENFVVFWS